MRYCYLSRILTIYLDYVASITMSMVDSQQGFIKCPDCDFISLSQGGLGVHHSKRHNIRSNLCTLNVFSLKGNLSIVVYVMSQSDQFQISENT